MTRGRAVFGALLLALFSTAGHAYLSSDPDLPPVGGVYNGVSDPPVVFHLTGLGDPNWGLDQLRIYKVAHGVLGPDTNPDPNIEEFDSEIRIMLAVNGFPAFEFFDPLVPVIVNSVEDSVVGPVTSWNNEMVDMLIQGTVAGLQVEIREDPDRRSLGTTTRADLGGGLYDFKGDFNVFTEIRVFDGVSDTGWVDSSGGSNGDGSHDVHLPLPSALSLVVLGLAGVGMVRRRRQGS